MRKLDNNAHSVFLLCYHLILVVKYRKRSWMIRSRIAHEKSLNTLRPNIISPWKSGITMRTMSISCSVPIRSRNSVNLSMPIKVPAAVWSKKSIRRSGRSSGRKCSGVRASASWVPAELRSKWSASTSRHRGRKNMNVVYRFRIYPNKIQQELFAKTFGCVRFVYNRMLSEKKECYEKTGKNLKVTPAKYKAEFPWLKEVDSLALCNA